MRAIIVFVLSCASVFGADHHIRVVSTAKTNAETASITTIDSYIKDGQTNLVRQTKTTGGVLQIRIHRFYHGDTLVGEFVAMPDSSGFTTEAGTAYSISLECDASRTPKSVVIGTKDGIVLDAFRYTNGVFSPVGSSAITNANAAGSQTRTEIEKLSEKSKKQ